jgi:PKD repeat protein
MSESRSAHPAVAVFSATILLACLAAGALSPAGSPAIASREDAPLSAPAAGPWQEMSPAFSEVGRLDLGGAIWSAVIDPEHGFAYFGSGIRIYKVRLSDFTVVGTLQPDPISGYWAATIDPANDMAYFGASIGRVVKIRLSDFTTVDSLLLGADESALYSGVIDTVNGYTYFATRTVPGRIIKIRLADFTRAGTLILESPDDNFTSGGIDMSNGFAYFGTDTGPGRIVKVRLSDFTRVGALALQSGENYLEAAPAIDAANGFAYFATYGVPGRVVKVRLSDLTRVESLLLGSPQQNFLSSVIDLDNGYAYFGAHSTPGVFKVRLSDFTQVGGLTMGAGNLLRGVIDQGYGFAYFGTDSGQVVKVDLWPPFAAGFASSSPNWLSQTTEFTNTSSVPAIASYRWDFGDGTVATSTSPTHTYATAGLYPVVLTSTTARASGTTSQTVVVYGPPNASLDIDSHGWVGASTRFTATAITVPSGDSTVAFTWNFGDGNAGPGPWANNHTYNAPGAYTVTVTAANAAGSAAVSDTVTVFSAPTVTAASTSPDWLGQASAFTSTVSSAPPGDPSLWYLWSFGDGVTSTLQNPTHTYAAPGIHFATIAATNPAATVTATVPVTIYGPPMTAFSSTSPDYLGQTTWFTNATTTVPPGDPTLEYAWSFGDGTESAVTQPSHTYLAPGIYTVVLTATNPAALAWSTHNVSIFSSPTADFMATPISGVRPLQVSFTAVVTTTPAGDPLLAYAWAFGDGTTSMVANPVHVYAAAGAYTVTLVVSNPAGQDGMTRTSFITVSPIPVVAAFSATPLTGYAPLTVAFTNASSGDYTDVLWDFGDGTSSTTANPVHAYSSPGAYSVTLTVSGTGGIDVAVMPSYIRIAYRVYLPVVMKTLPPTPTPTSTPTRTPTATPTPPSEIYGNVAKNGTPAAGIPVHLRFFNGSIWSTRAVVSTSSNGSYVFTDVAALAIGDQYQVIFSQQLAGWANSAYLSAWSCNPLSAYGAGTRVRGGDFDVADVPLVQPSAGATTILPFTFSWRPRYGVPTDTYRFGLFDAADGDPSWWSAELGYTAGYKFSALPSGYTNGVQYAWAVRVYGPDGFGQSYGGRSVGFAPAPPGIYGWVTNNAAASASTPLHLMWFDGSTWSVRMTTTTSALGFYLFQNVPALSSGQQYQVLFSQQRSGSSSSAFLSSWWCQSMSSYSAGASIHGGNFDTANVFLDGPAPDAAVSLPRAFTWVARSGTPTDNYEFSLLDPVDNDPWWSSGQIGYGNAYALTTLPAGFYVGPSYRWSMVVYGPDGHGASYESRSVAFSNAGP